MTIAMIRSHKIRIYPNKNQEKYFSKCLGIARLAYNWMLGEWGNEYLAGNKLNELSLRRKFNAIKRKEFPFITEVSKCVPQNALINLGRSFQGFFKKKSGYPRFKSKHNKDTSIRMDDGAGGLPKIRNKYIRFAKLKSWVKMSEEPRFKGKLISSTLSLKAGQWFVSLAFECEAPDHTVKTHKTCGVGSSGLHGVMQAKLPSVKQEF